MPRELIFPKLDWKKIYRSGQTFEKWIDSAESAEKAETMTAARREFVADSGVKGFVKGLPQKVYVVAIAEDWCGDVVRHVPILQGLADLSSKLNVRYIRRDHPEQVLLRFLTNGGEAIPKFIFLNRHFVECGNWGPLPTLGNEAIARGKACGDPAGARKKVARLYQADSDGQLAIDELMRLLRIASSVRP